MNANNIIKLLKLLGVGDNIRVDGEWVNCSCPFARWLHSKGSDSRPSFGVSIGKRSHYHCFSCQKSGSLYLLPTGLTFLTGRDYDAARSFVMKNENLVSEEFETDDVSEPTEVLSILPTIILKRYDQAQAHHFYCRERRLGDDALRQFKIRYDPQQERLLFPVFDDKKRLVGVRGRATNETLMPKYREYSELSPTRSSPKAHGIWYGQWMPPDKNKKLVLVEGEMDAVMLWQHLRRPGIWASMGATISKEQLKTLEGIRSNPILLFFDDDKAGHAATNKVIKHLKGVLPNVYRVMNYSGRKDPDEIVRAGALAEAFRQIERVG